MLHKLIDHFKNIREQYKIVKPLLDTKETIEKEKLTKDKQEDKFYNVFQRGGRYHKRDCYFATHRKYSEYSFNQKMQFIKDNVQELKANIKKEPGMKQNGIIVDKNSDYTAIQIEDTVTVEDLYLALDNETFDQLPFVNLFSCIFDIGSFKCISYTDNINNCFYAIIIDGYKMSSIYKREAQGKISCLKRHYSSYNYYEIDNEHEVNFDYDTWKEYGPKVENITPEQGFEKIATLIDEIYESKVIDKYFESNKKYNSGKINTINHNEFWFLSKQQLEEKTPYEDVALIEKNDLYYYVALNNSRVILGNIDLSLSRYHKEMTYGGNVSYHIYKPFRNKGYMSQALTALQQNVMQDKNLMEKEFYISTDNSPNKGNIYSQKAAINAGAQLVFDGEVPDDSLAVDGITAVKVYKLTIGNPINETKKIESKQE